MDDEEEFRARVPMNRPIPWRGDSPPDGYEYVAVVDPDWAVLDGTEQANRCRFGGGGGAGKGRRACGLAAVAKMKRGRRYPGGFTFWAYCPDHMFGRWIEDGKVMMWILREVPSDASVTP